MLTLLKKNIHGFTYLLRHPNQLKHIIIRETLYRQRNQNRQGWVEWQKYDTYTAAAQHSTAIAYARPLNLARIQTFSTMVSSIGNRLMVLDVGCGDGVISEPISKMGNYVTSIDLPTITMVAHKRRVSSVVSGDAEQLAFKPNSFDLVLASEVVEHLWNPNSFFEEATRVLKPKGHLIIETPEGKEGLRYDAHKHYFTVEILKQMLDTRFNIAKVKRLKPNLGAPTPTIIVLFTKKQ